MARAFRELVFQVKFQRIGVPSEIGHAFIFFYREGRKFELCVTAGLLRSYFDEKSVGLCTFATSHQKLLFLSK